MFETVVSETSDSLNSIIMKYIDKVSMKFKVDKKDIVKCWNVTLTKEKTEKPKKEKKNNTSAKNEAVTKLNESAPKISIRKNAYGNFEHLETGFVFNKDTQKVFGRQEGDKIIGLTRSDIEKCKEMKFQFEMRNI